jgi:hypothetical protein
MSLRAAAQFLKSNNACMQIEEGGARVDQSGQAVNEDFLRRRDSAARK